MRVRKITFALLAFGLTGLTLGAVGAGQATAANAPGFTTVKLPKSYGTAEPRAVVAPNGTSYVVTNGGGQNDLGFGLETVYRSADGVHWAMTKGQPADQTEATTDVDIVATRTGRIITSELDFGGINFRTDYSDDGGKTWTPSKLTTFADTDRQWFAVGPDDPTTHQPRVYMLFHNLLSGLAQHNMWVSTSTDGGATFGPPVPVATPPQQDYLDLQCADSGGPSNITVDQHTGRVYVVFGTRSSPIGGCAAQPAEINVVAANRVWVVSAAAADTATPGAWTPHLAVNDTGPPAHIVGMQLAPGAVDTGGNVYVAYPESIHDYPDYDGAAIKVVHASPKALDKWSAPTVVAKSGGAGNVLPHIIAGAPGRIDVAWYHGVNVKGHKPNWYSYAAQSLDALSAQPHWTRVRLSSVLGESNQTASELMGACMQGQEATLNGFACGRSTDVNGIAIDKCGRLLVAWPAQISQGATYVSTQISGPRLLRTSCAPTATAATDTGSDSGSSNGSGGSNVAVGNGLPDTGTTPLLPLAALALMGAGGALWIWRRRLS